MSKKGVGSKRALSLHRVIRGLVMIEFDFMWLPHLPLGLSYLSSKLPSDKIESK